MELFPPAGPLIFLAIDIKELLPKTGVGNEFSFIMKKNCTKLHRAIPGNKIIGDASRQ